MIPSSGRGECFYANIMKFNSDQDIPVPKLIVMMHTNELPFRYLIYPCMARQLNQIHFKD